MIIRYLLTNFVIVFVFLAIFIEGKDFEYCRIIKLRGGQFSWIMGFLPICKDAILWKRRFLVLLGKINLS